MKKWGGASREILRIIKYWRMRKTGQQSLYSSSCDVAVNADL